MHPVTLDHWLRSASITIPPLYLVGGTVRDLLLGCQPKDIDLVCRNAKDFAYRLGAYKNAAVVAMEKKPGEPCYRIIDRTHPDNFLDLAEMRGSTIYEDLAKRDFTMNSIAAEVEEDCTAGPLIDPFSGEKDLEHKIIRMTDRGAFASDPLRILRAIRFSATLGFTIEPGTIEEMKTHAALLQRVSGERVTAELLFILETHRSSTFIRKLDQIGVLEVLFPEILSMKGCKQNSFHHKDVWDHSLLVMKNCEQILNNLTGYFGDRAGNVLNNLSGNNRLPLLKMAALFHDIGKPLTREIHEETERITFYRHDKEGAKLVDAISERMKLSSKDRDCLVILVAEHLHILRLSDHSVRTATLMRWFRKMKDDTIPAIILGIADVESSLGEESTEEWRNSYLAWSKNTVKDYYETIRHGLIART